ncbi:MAG: glycosyltransferase family 39 protein [Gammaproteobacteria bacterium]|nr:glycosyltransferase family 39 protein [Gammaproteobacteria bacterium]
MPVCIFLLAFSINLLHVGMAEWGGGLLSAYPRSDAYIYIYQAWYTAFIDSNGGFSSVFMSPSLYVWLQTIAYKLFGPHYSVPLLVNAMLVSFSAVFCSLTTRRLFIEQVGWIAGVIFTLCGPIVFFSGITVKTNLVLFLLALACYFAIRFFQDVRYWWAFTATLTLGLAAMERQNLLLLIIFLISFIVLHGWRTASKKELIKIYAACVSAVALLFVISAWNPNEIEPKIFSPVGLNFYVGTAPKSWGGYTFVEGIRNDIIGHRTQPQRLLENESGRPVSRWEVSQFWFKKSLDYYAKHPLDYLVLQLRKAGLLVAQYSQGLPEQYHVWRWKRPALMLAFIDTGLMLIFFGFGLFYLRSRVGDPGLKFLIIGSILYSLSVWIFFIGERYRLTLIVLLVPIAAYGIWSILQNRSIKKIALSIGIILLFYGGSWGLNNLIPYGPGWAEDHDRFLAREQKKQHKERRVNQLMTQVVYKPNIEAWLELSKIFERRGLLPDAKTFAERAIASAPSKSEGYERMLDLLNRNSAESEREIFSLLLEKASSEEVGDQRALNALKQQLSRLKDKRPIH